MTQSLAVPARKVFAELFSKSDHPAPQRPALVNYCTHMYDDSVFLFFNYPFG